MYPFRFPSDPTQKKELQDSNISKEQTLKLILHFSYTDLLSQRVVVGHIRPLGGRWHVHTK